MCQRRIPNQKSCEEAIIKLKAAALTPPTQLYYVVNQILYALVQGCESKDVKIIKVCVCMPMCNAHIKGVFSHFGNLKLMCTLPV